MTKRKDPTDLKPRGFQKGGAAYRAPGGDGWGGGANGAGSGVGSIQTHAPFTGAENPSGLPGFRGLSKAQRLDACKEVWWDVMTDKSEAASARIIAADKFYDREDGKAVQKIVTPESGPEWFIEGVPEAESVEAWTEQAALATVRPAGNAD